MSQVHWGNGSIRYVLSTVCPLTTNLIGTLSLSFLGCWEAQLSHHLFSCPMEYRNVYTALTVFLPSRHVLGCPDQSSLKPSLDYTTLHFLFLPQTVTPSPPFPDLAGLASMHVHAHTHLANRCFPLVPDPSALWHGPFPCGVPLPPWATVFIYPPAWHSSLILLDQSVLHLY